MASASRRLPARSLRFMPRGRGASPRLTPRLRRSPGWWRSISATATARRISATVPSGLSSANSFLLRSRFPLRRYRARRHHRHPAPENRRRWPRLQPACAGRRTGTAHRSGACAGGAVAGPFTGRLDYAAGFIFMRRMGSAALTATGPVLNVLPLAVNIHPQECLPELAQRPQTS